MPFDLPARKPPHLMSICSKYTNCFVNQLAMCKQGLLSMGVFVAHWGMWGTQKVYARIFLAVSIRVAMLT